MLDDDYIQNTCFSVAEISKLEASLGPMLPRYRFYSTSKTKKDILGPQNQSTSIEVFLGEGGAFITLATLPQNLLTWYKNAEANDNGNQKGLNLEPGRLLPLKPNYLGFDISMNSQFPSS